MQEENTSAAPTKDDPTVSLVPVHVMGRRYEVPPGLTIMKAMEYAGFKFIRGCGWERSNVGRMPVKYVSRQPMRWQWQSNRTR